MPGYHEHDGFYMRLLLGVGYLHSSASYQGDSMAVSGVGVTMGAAFGGALTPNLIIYGEFVGTIVSDPTLEYNGQSGTASGLTASMMGFGPGIAYYIDPNLYFSGTLLFTRLSFSDSNSNEDVASTDLGFGAGFTVGKEWWISRDWGIGLAGQFMVASMKDKDVDTRWTGLSGSLLFSATYN